MTALLDLPLAPRSGASTHRAGSRRSRPAGSPGLERPDVDARPATGTASGPAASGQSCSPATGAWSAPRWVEPARSRSVHDAGGRVLERPAAAPWSEPQRVRLTRRGRLTVTVLSLLCTLLVLGVSAVQSGSAGGGLAEAPRSVVVQEGDTLWQIAREIAPAESPAVVVLALQEANDLGAGPLRPGQVLLVPKD